MKSRDLLNFLRQDVLLIKETVEKEFIDMPLQRLNWKETHDHWSILECLEHLNSYGDYYIAQLRNSIAQARQINNAENDARSTWLGAKFIKMMHPYNTNRQKTFKRMNPAGSKLDQAVLEKFLRQQDELLRLIDAASLVNLNTTRIPVEFMKLLKLNLGDALQFVVVHEQRHLNQAKNVRSKTSQIPDATLRI